MENRINTKELRLGNHYKFKDSKNYPKTITLHELNIQSLADYPQDYENLLLEDLDLEVSPFFIKAGISWINTFIDVELQWDEEAEAYMFFWRNLFVKNIKYVHELQNIIYHLSGEEAEIIFK